MRVLVIGGTRFIGRATVPELLRRGHEVTVFHRGSSPNPVGDRVAERLGDRLDADSVRRAIESASFDGVVDIAYAWDARTGAREIAHVADALRENTQQLVELIKRELELGEAKLLAGGFSLIPLLRLRLAQPAENLHGLLFYGVINCRGPNHFLDVAQMAVRLLIGDHNVNMIARQPLPHHAALGEVIRSQLDFRKLRTQAI